MTRQGEARQPVDAVIFDFGNVLIDWNPRHLFRSFFTDEADLERFLAEVWTPAENERCDRGRPFAEMVEELSAEHPDHADAIAASAPGGRWIEMIGGEIPGTLAVMDDLVAAGIRLYGLSNFSAETFPLVREAYESFDRLDDLVISGELDGIAKPDRAIFDLLAERNGLDPSRTVFVDDAPGNVEAAASYGYRTIRFTDADALRARLEEWGVLPPRPDV